MRFRRLLLTAACALAAAACAGAASACTVANSYRVPTNLELAEKADVILLGEIESAPADMKGMAKADMVVRTTEVLKGGPVAERIRLFGMTAPARFAVRSNPNQLEQAHPLAYIGGCVRYMFVPHSTLVFFLQRRDGQLVPLAEPFARWAEDVPSADALWVRAVRLYVEAAALPERERRAMLAARRDALRARKDDPGAQTVAADVDRQLKGPNRRWNDIMREEVARMNARTP